MGAVTEVLESNWYVERMKEVEQADEFELVEGEELPQGQGYVKKDVKEELLQVRPTTAAQKRQVAGHDYVPKPSKARKVMEPLPPPPGLPPVQGTTSSSSRGASP